MIVVIMEFGKSFRIVFVRLCGVDWNEETTVYLFIVTDEMSIKVTLPVLPVLVFGICLR